MKKRYILALLAFLLVGLCAVSTVTATSSYSKTGYDSYGNYINEIWTKVPGAYGYTKTTVYSDYTANMVSYTLMPKYYAKTVYKSTRYDTTSYKTYYGYKISNKYTKSGSKTRITIKVKKKSNKIAKNKKVFIIYKGKTYARKTNSKGVASIKLTGSPALVKKYSFVYW